MKIKGKKITNSQRKLLAANGFDSNQYLYVKSAVYNEGDENSNKSGQNLSANISKVEYLIFVNKETGEEIKCESRRL